MILSPTLQVPSHWVPSKYTHSAGGIVSAAEGGYPLRQWPVKKYRAIKENYLNDQLVLVGTQADTEIF